VATILKNRTNESKAMKRYVDRFRTSDFLGVLRGLAMVLEASPSRAEKAIAEELGRLHRLPNLPVSMFPLWWFPFVIEFLTQYFCVRHHGTDFCNA
jgi:hypothetical protein